MRHELGSKSRMCPADISCYRDQLTRERSAIVRVNQFLTIRIPMITYQISYYWRGSDLRKYSANSQKVRSVWLMAAMQSWVEPKAFCRTAPSDELPRQFIRWCRSAKS